MLPTPTSIPARFHSVATLPGQDDYAAFFEEDRRLYAELIAHGLTFAWPDFALPAHAPWIPQTAAPNVASEGVTFGAARHGPVVARQIQAEVDKIRAKGQLELAHTEASNAAKAEIQEAKAAFQLAEAGQQADITLVQEHAQARAAELTAEAGQRRTQARIDAEMAQLRWRLEQQEPQSQASEEERRVQAGAVLRAASEEADVKAVAHQERQAAEEDAARMKAQEEAAESTARMPEHHARELKAAEDAQLARESAAASKEREAAASPAGRGGSPAT